MVEDIPEVDTAFGEEVDEIESIEDVPTIESHDELEEMLSEVEKLVEEGEGSYDACMRVADNDLELILLNCIRSRES